MTSRLLVPLFVMTGAFAFGEADLHSCEVAPDIQKSYWKARDLENRVTILREALKAHPENICLNRSLAGEYRAKLDGHPGEPLYLYLYGHPLIGIDTSQEIRHVDEAIAKDADLICGRETK